MKQRRPIHGISYPRKANLIPVRPWVRLGILPVLLSATVTATPGLGGASSASGALAPAGAPAAPPAETPAPPGISPQGWRSMLRHVAEADLDARPVSDPGTEAAWLMRNRDQEIEARFVTGGMRISPGRGGAAGWSWGLALIGAGAAGSVVPAEPASLFVAGNRVELRRRGLVEWYLNDRRGVEQGFTLLEPPAGNPPRLELLLAMSGSLSPSVDPDARSLALRDAAGTTVLAYEELHAFDATGRPLAAWMDLPATGGDRLLRISVDVANAVFPVVVDPWIGTQTRKLTAAGTGALGHSVSISGDTAVVGAHTSGGGLGSAFVFERNAGGPDNWGQVKTLTAPGAVWFGFSVSLDGDTVVVGAPLDDSIVNDSGAAFVFERDAGGADNWGLVKELTAGDAAASDRLGGAVSISGDTIVVGAEQVSVGGKGKAYVFQRDAGGVGQWGQVRKLVAADGLAFDQFGSSASIRGGTVIIGARRGDTLAVQDAGSAYLFERDAGGLDNWGQVKELTASDPVSFDAFGASVSISGDTVAIGAPFDDRSISDTDHGSVYLFERHSGGTDNWGQVQKVIHSAHTSLDQLGTAVSIEGTLLVAGAIGHDLAGESSGAAYVFERHTGGANSWGQVLKLTAADAAALDQFGVSVSISGNTVVVGADLDDDMGGQSGSAYVFHSGLTVVCGDGIPEAAEACDDGNTAGGDACSADCSVAGTGVPGEAGAGMLAAPAGASIEVTFTPACSATDHAVYWGHGPIGPGGLQWTGSACGLGTTGVASFDPGVLLPGEWVYFVVVGYDGDDEGGYGADSALAPRPEAMGVGACDRPAAPATCP